MTPAELNKHLRYICKNTSTYGENSDKVRHTIFNYGPFKDMKFEGRNITPVNGLSLGNYKLKNDKFYFIMDALGYNFKFYIFGNMGTKYSLFDYLVAHGAHEDEDYCANIKKILVTLL